MPTHHFVGLQYIRQSDDGSIEHLGGNAALPRTYLKIV